MKNFVDRPQAPCTVLFFAVTILFVSACGSDRAVQNEPPIQVQTSTGQVTRPEESDHERLERLRREALQLMIAAAQRALDIGPFQIRIDKAVTAGLALGITTIGNLSYGAWQSWWLATIWLCVCFMCVAIERTGEQIDQTR